MLLSHVHQAGAIAGYTRWKWFQLIADEPGRADARVGHQLAGGLAPPR